MNPIIMIPARLQAQRFPNKPLALIQGKPMIVHVIERALAANIGPVAVACCSQEIVDAVKNTGVQAILTDPSLPSGTDRIHAAVNTLDPQKHYDVVINLQGDLPTIPGDDILKAMTPLKNSAFGVGTLAAPLDLKDIHNPNAVKIALAHTGQALYFSRAPIPYESTQYYHHIGIYAYRREVLESFVRMPPSPLEKCERLEQLRLLEAGIGLGVALTATFPQSVDVPEDLDIVTRQLEQVA